MTTLAGGSTCTIEIFAQSTLFALHTACSSAPSGSPGDTATRLPSRSLGVFRFASASETTEKPVELSSDITDWISAPLAAVVITDEESAMPKVSEPAATTWTVFADPRPSLIVRSRPSAAKKPRSLP
ncbi:MAG: hypothetical protein U1F51_21565 [Burkholderiales bacterium]